MVAILVGFQVAGLLDFVFNSKSRACANQPLFHLLKSGRVWISDYLVLNTQLKRLQTNLLSKLQLQSDYSTKKSMLS